MKILVVQDYLRSGGTERQSILLANALAAAGSTVTLLTFRPGGKLADSVDPAVHRHSLQPIDLHLDWFAPGLLRAVSQLQPDVILCMGRMANCRAGELSEAQSSAVVIGTMRTGKPLPAAFQRSLHRVRHVIANSQEARNLLLARHQLPPEKVSVIYNSLVFAPEAKSKRPPPLRAEHGATSATAVLLCVAMFRPEKNQRELIEIAAALPAGTDWQLWLAGDGPARAECERLVAGRQLGDRVKFLGFHADPTPLYRAADIAVHASRSESLSNFLIEAQAHGLPAVVCAAQGIGECFVPNQTGWIVPQGDRAGFLDRLQPLIADPARREACAAPARAYAREHFDADRQVQAYLDLFARLAPPASPP